LHDGKIQLSVIQPKSFRSAAVMNVVRSQILKRIPEARETFGYLTKAIRQTLGFGKAHATDAFVIAGGRTQKRCVSMKMFFKRKNNRSLQLNRSGFKPSIRRQRYNIQPYDLVRWQGKWYKAVGIQNKGAYLKMADGRQPIVKNVNEIERVFHQKSLMVV